MKIGDRVECSAYIKRSKNHYEIINAKDTQSGNVSCSYWANEATEGIEVEDFHNCERYKTIGKTFTGVFVGTTTLCTRLNAESYDEPYVGDGYRTYCDRPEKFAVVYYANNRRRLVPISMVTGDSNER